MREWEWIMRYEEEGERETERDERERVSENGWERDSVYWHRLRIPLYP